MPNNNYSKIYHYWYEDDDGPKLSFNECHVYALVRLCTFEYNQGFCKSERYISDRLKISINTVRRCLKVLESKGLVSISKKGERKTTIIKAVSKDHLYKGVNEKICSKVDTDLENKLNEKICINNDTDNINSDTDDIKVDTDNENEHIKVDTDEITVNENDCIKTDTDGVENSNLYQNGYRSNNNEIQNGTDEVQKGTKTVSTLNQNYINFDNKYYINIKESIIYNTIAKKIFEFSNPKTEQEEQQIIFEYCMVQCILNQNFKTDNPELTEFCKVFRKENEARFGSDSIKNTMNSITNYDCKQSVEHLKTNLLTAKDKQSIIRFYYFVDEYFDLIEQEKQAIKNRDEELRIKVFTDSGMSREEAIEFLKKGEDDDRIRIEINNQQD